MGSTAHSLLAYYALLILVFAAVGLLVDDIGLILVHSLAPIAALLVPLIPLSRRIPSPPRAALLAVLLLLPIGAALFIHAQPRALIWGLDRFGGVEIEGEDADGGGSVRDSAARLGPSRSQQLFRLHMLANPQILRQEGLIASERVAVQYATLQDYAQIGGFAGAGYLGATLPRHLGVTYLSDLVPLVFVLADFGRAGIFAVGLLYVLLVTAVAWTARSIAPDDRWGTQGLYVALVATLAFALPGLYMLLANLNLTLFTGKNATLLSLSSISDVLQGGLLLALAAFSLGLRTYFTGSEP